MLVFLGRFPIQDTHSITKSEAELEIKLRKGQSTRVCAEKRKCADQCRFYKLCARSRDAAGVEQLLVHCRCTSCCASVAGGANVEIDQCTVQTQQCIDIGLR